MGYNLRISRLELCCSVLFFLIAFSSTSKADFTLSKEAVDSTSGSETETDTNRIINYVVGINNDSTVRDNVEITDVPDSNQQYVTGSLVVPSFAVPSWSTDGGLSFVTTEPSSGVNALRATIDSLAALGKGVVSADLAPLNISTASGGDGYTPIVFENLKKVFVIYHHKSGVTGNSITCVDVTSNSICTDYPKTFNATSNFASAIYAPNRMAYYLSGNRIYFNAITNHTSYVSGGNLDFGIACWDVFTNSACTNVTASDVGFVPLSTGIPITASDIGEASEAITPVQLISNKLYLAINGTVYCYDPSINAACSGFTPTLVVTGLGALDKRKIFSFAVDNASDKKLIISSIFGSGRKNYCFDVQANAVCSGGAWPAVPAAGNGGTKRMPLPFVDPVSGLEGFCSTVDDDYCARSFRCYDMSGNLLTSAGLPYRAYEFTQEEPSGALSTPTPATCTTFTMGSNYSYWKRVGNKVYLANYSGDANPAGDRTYCWDFDKVDVTSTGSPGGPYTLRGGPCEDFYDYDLNPGVASSTEGNIGVRIWNGNTNQSSTTIGNVGAIKTYGYESFGDCLIGLGHSGTLFSFDPITGSAPCSSYLVAIADPDTSFYCDGKARTITWDNLETASVLPSGASLTASVYNAADSLVSGPAALPLDLSAVPYTGDNTSLTAQITVVGHDDPINVSFGFNAADSPQICYQTRVLSGPGTTVVNNVSSPSASGSTSVDLVIPAAEVSSLTPEQLSIDGSAAALFALRKKVLAVRKRYNSSCGIFLTALRNELLNKLTGLYNEIWSNTWVSLAASNSVSSSSFCRQTDHSSTISLITSDVEDMYNELNSVLASSCVVNARVSKQIKKARRAIVNSLTEKYNSCLTAISAYPTTTLSCN